jgi:hypothetical protein
LNDRKAQVAWKKNYSEALASLTKELKRLGATSWLLTRNDTHNPDGGVAIYLTMQPDSQEAWQEALGFIGEVPTVEQIDRAYREKARKIHPDGPSPDPVLFNALTEHRDRARAWARGEQTVAHDKVIACDVFKEQRWNLNAIRLTIGAMRQMERCGASAMMERAWRGFSKQITARATEAEKDHEPVTA